MEFVDQIIAYLTPYFGEYARYAPIAIGVVLAALAFLIKRALIKGMTSDAKPVESQVSESEATPGAKEEPSDATPDVAPSDLAQEVTATKEAPEAEAEPLPKAQPAVQEQPVVAKEPVPEPTLSWSQRIKAGLARTRSGLGSGLSSIVMGSKKLDDDLLEELETQLLMADVGVEATQALIDSLTDKLNRKELKDTDALMRTLKSELKDILVNSEQPLVPEKQEGPFVILMVGVNGVGKTTTIGKLAKKYQAEGKSVMLAAGDTFRAAAVEQLQVWGERNNVPVVAQHTGADSASVIYDAIESAKSRGVDIVIADTAGRLQNKANLMNELEKVVRVMKKLDVEAPHEVMLVLDAGTGQNALSQAKLFTEAVGVSGITLTKLDGTAKGGIIFAIAKQFGLPIRYIGVGEQAEDLRPFKSQEFVDALFASE
ncbi:signal recognition particle-docking protein FtsY [Marinomonas ostreistagni]|uniref:signal recognition particle-docking protein FtsY n=1 Tax=Marinomonas ostreistagni TaxID=359209 RepID=UPI00195141F9|nr:signal recognition particle-docking protein FtsY [Marinomonas ostreistagni]MBM6550539.1 signal recognition particle-docking protein FtsY [Marinomonas ostreistagni]